MAWRCFRLFVITLLGLHQLPTTNILVSDKCYSVLCLVLSEIWHFIEYLLSKGISFAELHSRGIDAVVARIRMDFKVPLRSGDEFVCSLSVKKEDVRYVFMQNIYRASDRKLCLRAKVESVCVEHGELMMGSPEMDRLLFGIQSQK